MTKEIEECMKLTKVYINQNFFTFKNQFYEQKSGLTIGDPLFPFLANLYMCCIEIHIKKNPYIYKVFCRYADNIFGIVKKTTYPVSIKITSSAR